jgi:hypothetical protein
MGRYISLFLLIFICSVILSFSLAAVSTDNEGIFSINLIILLLLSAVIACLIRIIDLLKRMNR